MRRISPRHGHCFGGASRAACYAFGVQSRAATSAFETAPNTSRGEFFMSMRTRVLLHLTAGALSIATAVGARAANLGFLNDTPVSYMKQRDVDSIKKAVFAVLNDKQAGERETWL